MAKKRRHWTCTPTPAHRAALLVNLRRAWLVSYDPLNYNRVDGPKLKHGLYAYRLGQLMTLYAQLYSQAQAEVAAERKAAGNRRLARNANLRQPATFNLYPLPFTLGCSQPPAPITLARPGRQRR